MNAVLYYSNTGGSKRIAEVMAQKTGYALSDITKEPACRFDNAVLVFPVHCQSIPTAVKKFLGEIAVGNMAAIATYGRKCHGNVLNELQNGYGHNIVAAAYVPTKHSYVNDREFDDFDSLNGIADKLSAPSPVKIPRSYKNIFSGFFPRLRSRMGVKLYRTAECDGCGVCDSVCDGNAVTKGKPNGRCIRCLKCVHSCPKYALRFSLRLPMRLYLKKRKHDDLIIYV